MPGAQFIDGSGQVIVPPSSVDPNQPLGTVNLLSTGEPTFHDDGEIPDCTGNTMSVPGQPTAVASAGPAPAPVPDGAVFAVCLSSSDPRCQ